MSDLPVVTPGYFQILVVRELRKIGFDVGEARIHRRSELPEPVPGFVLELAMPLSWSGSSWRSLVVCRRQSSIVGLDVIESVQARLPEVPADIALVFATADFATDAVVTAQEAGIPLFRVVDGRSAFDMSGWSTPGHYPAWLPAYLAQLVDRDISGQQRVRLLEAGGAELVAACLIKEGRWRR
jgi:restriction system protein